MTVVSDDRTGLVEDPLKTALFEPFAERFYRPDIQGLRAVSALLIMAYHIWLVRVSGGVDVFFVISGFLMTTVLLRQVASAGRILPLQFWHRVFRRVFPAAYLVLVMAALGTLLFVSPPLWKYAVNEFVTSAAHVENLELIRMGSSYLDRESPPSVFQHFWALSIQMQFYVILLAILFPLVAIAKRRNSLRWMRAGIMLVIAVSFSYSVVETERAPEASYFNTAARVWEFLVGSLVASLYPWLSARLSKGAHLPLFNYLAGLAFAGLLTLGLWNRDLFDFPGWIALMPVASAAILIGSGSGPRQALANRLLATPWLAKLGGFAFTVYLWHWPVLVFSQHYWGTTQLGFLEGLTVMVVSISLAWLTKRYVEDPLIRRTSFSLKSLSRQIVYVVASVGVGLLARYAIIETSESYLANLERNGTNVVAGPIDSVQSEVSVPLSRLITIDLDRPRGISCLSRICELGDPDGSRHVVVLGASHSAQWVDLFDQLGKQEGFRLTTFLNQDDNEYVRRVLKPDVVVTMGTKTSASSDAAPESVPEQYVDQWHYFTGHGIDVLAIRDNPRFSFFQNACVADNQTAAERCAVQREYFYEELNPAKAYESEIAGLNVVDFTPLLCSDVYCPAVHDDILMYYDKHHLSRTYVMYIADEVGQLLATDYPELW